MTEWYQAWFGQEYLELYPHRDELEAARAVELLETRHVIAKTDLVLDLACGAGRHALAFKNRGIRSVGLDLSMVLLLAARKRAGGVPLIRGDLRALPVRTGAIDVAVNLFTSFGYFEHDQQHQEVLDEVARVLRKGGRFVLDFLNAPRVRETLVPRDEQQMNGRTMVQERVLTDNGRFVVKTISLPGDGRQFMERVRLYERSDLERMIAKTGMMVDDVLGDYEGAPHTETSPRVLVLAHRA